MPKRTESMEFRHNPGKPFKKKRPFNRKFSKAKVVLEHTISKLKKFRIFRGEFRNRLDVTKNIVHIIVNMWKLETSKSASLLWG